MLRQLRIKDVVLVDHAEVNFGDSLNVISGETGSGKSAIMGALSLVLGARADSGLLRKNSKKAVVEALFDIDSRPEIRAALEEAGIDHLDHDQIVVRREVLASGKSRAFVNNQMAHLVLLKQLGPLLVDLVGQHANRDLLSVETHRDILDTYGNLWPLRHAFSETHRAERSAAAELDALVSSEAQRLREAEVCRMEIDELEEADLKEGEEDTLFQEYTLMANGEELSERVSVVLDVLSGDRGSVLSELAQQQGTFTHLVELDDTLKEQLDSYNSAIAELQELDYTLRTYRSGLDYNPARYQQIGERLSTINKLKRKYGQSVEEMLAYLERSQERLGELETADERIDALRDEVEQARIATEEAANVLSEGRREAAKRMAVGVEKIVHTLNMGSARFEVGVTAQERTATGDERVEFFLAPNVGERMAALKDCASGGEMSRVMIAVKTLLAGKQRTPTLIFDEIDSNIGGTTATVVAKQLKEISGAHQVICITHFAQVAEQAEYHLLISKEEEEGRTLTRISQLKPKDRERELERMLGKL